MSKIVNVKYTQPKLFEGHKINTHDHKITCHDSETFANGIPVPIGDDAIWGKIFENIEKLDDYQIIE